MECATHSFTRRGYSKTEISITGVFCAIGGIVVGAFIACLWYHRHRLLRHLLFNRPPEVGSVPIVQDPPTTRYKYIPTEMEIFNAHLPTPEANGDLGSDFTGLMISISFYAESYFGGPSPKDLTVQHSVVDNQISGILGEEAPLGAHEVVALLNSAKDRVKAVRFLMAWAMLKNVIADGKSDGTLLPPEIAECIRSMRKDGPLNDGAIFLESKWRHITGERMRRTYSVYRDDFAASDNRQQNMTRLATALGAVLDHFTNNLHEDGRSFGMVAIIKECATFAFKLFTQPTTWRFDWRTPEGRNQGPNQLVVSPRLVQVGDKKGKVRDPYLYLNSLEIVEVSVTM